MFTCGLSVTLVGSQVYGVPVGFLWSVFLRVWDLGGGVTWLMGVAVFVLLLWCCSLWVLWCEGLGIAEFGFFNEFQFAVALGCGIDMFLCVGDVVSGWAWGWG